MSDKTIVCHQCEGTCRVRDNKSTENGYQFGSMKCPTCEGRGELPVTVVDAGKQVLRCNICGDEFPMPLGLMDFVIAVFDGFQKAHEGCNGKPGKTRTDYPAPPCKHNWVTVKQPNGKDARVCVNCAKRD